MAEGLAVETLAHWARVTEFLPSDNTMAEFMDLKDMTYVSARREGKHKDRIFGHSFLCELVGFSQLKSP
jgi:hypothetical protein